MKDKINNNYQQQLITEIVETILETTMKFFDNNIAYNNSEKCLANFLNVNLDELTVIVRFIVEAFSQAIYLNKYQSIRDYVIQITSQELILFLAQEDKESELFHNNMMNFRNEMVNHITNNIWVVDNTLIEEKNHATFN